MSDFGDFDSPDPLVRYNAHQAAKGRAQMPDPDDVRKRERENAETPLQRAYRLGEGCGGLDAAGVKRLVELDLRCLDA